MNPVDSLRLTDAQLADVTRTLKTRIQAGLNQDGGEIRALPSYFGAPSRSVEGSALVIDTGGTNMRAAVVNLAQGKATVVSGPVKKTLPMRTGEKLSADEFFQAQAATARDLAQASGLAVGYCFSYPSENSPDKDSRLLRWTKGIDIPGVPGTLVGSQLGVALGKQGLAPGPVRVLNDTVASMLGGSWVHSEVPSERCIGLIVGTGYNMAAYYSAAQSSKIPKSFPGKMAVNLESGNFDPPHLSEYDRQVDAASDNPGFQRFEKAVSGYYLPFLFERILPGHPGFDPAQGTGALVALRDSGTGQAQQIAEALLARSADLVAATLVSVIDEYEPNGEPVGILAEGGFFWNDPQYAPRLSQTLTRLLAGRATAHVLQTDEANLVGSAVAALEV
jgi:hexokinase